MECCKIFPYTFNIKWLLPACQEIVIDQAYIIPALYEGEHKVHCHKKGEDISIKMRKKR
jgi:hypothetical protein